MLRIHLSSIFTARTLKPLNGEDTDNGTLTLTQVYYYTGDLKKEGTFNSYF